MAQYSLGDAWAAMTEERAREYGFVSRYNHTGSAATDQLANNLAMTSDEWWRFLVAPAQFILHDVGWAGAGFDPTVLPQLLLSLPWAAAFLMLRVFTQRRLSRLGIWLQVVVPKSDGAGEVLHHAQRRKLKKFQNQVWLAVYYIVSTVFGYAVQAGQPWFGLPVGEANRIALLTPHPYKPSTGLMCYYQYGLGFYISEMLALVAEHDIKRSDFMEYFVHHIVTVALIVISHCSYEHRFGVYVLFIHDASDIMLALSKIMNYVVGAQAERAKQRRRQQKRQRRGQHADEAVDEPKPSLLYRVVFCETTMTIFFVSFTIVFVFFRLVCLPYLALANVGYGLKIRMGTWSYCFLVLLLQGALQGLHVYWFIIILKVLISTAMGGRVEDIRSDDDDDSDTNDKVEGKQSPSSHPKAR